MFHDLVIALSDQKCAPQSNAWESWRFRQVCYHARNSEGAFDQTAKEN